VVCLRTGSAGRGGRCCIRIMFHFRCSRAILVGFWAARAEHCEVIEGEGIGGSQSACLVVQGLKEKSTA